MLELIRDDKRAAWWQRLLSRGAQLPFGSGLWAAGRLADLALFGFAAALGGLALGYLWHSHGEVLDVLDLVSGVVACLALWWRRDYPVAVTLVAFGAAWFSPLALGAGLVAMGTAASRARGRALVLIALLAVLGSVVFPLVNPTAGEMLKIGFPAFLLTVFAFGCGLYARARRELVASLRERAARLEADQQHSVEQAREAERRRIAWEMHDVLAHRLSLLSVHAGALEFRPDALPGEIAQAAGVIRASAAAALSELRQVITVLREDSDAAAEPPQPELAQLRGLLEESSAAGMTLREHLDLTAAEPLPAATQRAVYRVVQEGLTNARKHAPGAIVDVTVTGTEQAGLIAEIVSRRTPGVLPSVAAPQARRAPAGPEAAAASVPPPPGPPPGPGAGLIGLAERLALVGGELQHGTNANGDFVLRATIPGYS
jgi:signal transduction histidine kinase